MTTRSYKYNKFRIVLILLLIITGGHLFAEKTDTIYLVNGDRITGEIKRIEYGMLVYKTDALGTIDIKLEEVNTFYSKENYDIRLSNGYRMFGSIDTTSVPQSVNIVTANDRVLKPLIEIVEITPIKNSFLQRMNGNVNLGYSYTKASTVSQITFNGELRYRAPRYDSGIKIGSIITDQDNADRSRKNDFSINTYRIISGRWYAGINAALQQNSELGLQRRLQAGVGGGYDLLHTNLNRLFTIGAVVINSEISSDTSLTSNSFEGLAKIEYRIYKLRSPKINVTTYFSAYPSFTVRKRIRTEFDVQAKIEIISDLYLSLSYYNDYDNKPASGEKAKTDWAIITSIGYSF